MLNKILVFLMLLSGTAYASTEISTPGTNIGIGTNSVTNALSIASTLAIGNATYTSSTAPNGGAIIQGNVGIGNTAPGQALDVNGTIRATDIQGVSNTTFTVCSPTANVHWHCDYTVTGTNDQTQINAAITAANALTGGAHVLLTEGNFNIGANASPVVPLSNVWLQGSGMWGVTDIVCKSGLGSFGCIKTTSTISNFRISDMKIDGTNMRISGYNVDQKGIDIPNSSTTNIEIDHVWVYNTPATCVATDGNSYVTFHDSVLQLCGTSGTPTGPNGYPEGSNGFGYGTSDNNINKHVLVYNITTISVADAGLLIEEQGGTTAPDYGFTFSNNQDYGSYNAIRSSGNSGVIMNGNKSYNAVDSCYVATQDTFANIPFSNVIISSNICVNAGNHGIAVTTKPGSLASNIQIENNIIDTPAGDGILLYSTITSVTNNIIDNSGLDGIYWLTGQNIGDLNITGNKISGSGTLSTSTHQSAINLKINAGITVTNIKINDNLLKNSTGYGLDTELGSGTYTNFSLKGNDLIGNTLNSTNLTGSTFTVGTNFYPFLNHGFTTNNYIEGNLNVATNVGIGTSNPPSALDVWATVNPVAIFGGVSGGSNVGIGSPNPAAALDVNGTVRISSGGSTNTGVCWCTDGKSLGHFTGGSVTSATCANAGGTC